VINTDAKGERFLVLKNGRRYQGVPGRPTSRPWSSSSYSMRIESKQQELGAELGVRAMSTMALLANPNPYTMAELLWRVSAPLTCLVLILLAIPLGFVNPRAGSSANLIIALLIFFSYSNLSSWSRPASNRAATFGMAWWPLHLLAALAVVALFAWRLNLNHRYHPLVLLAVACALRRQNKKAASK
jgi:lipopolysaccharide export system permease protein